MVNLREWALPFYTILMQLAAGAMLALWVIRARAACSLSADELDRLVKRPLALILLTIFSAMVGSHFHLSRPFFSAAAVLNLRYSWLSREILFTVLFSSSTLALTILQWFRPQPRQLLTGLGWLAVTSGAACIYCMSRIYDLPIQAAWDSGLVTISFFGTALLVGVSALATMLLVDARWVTTSAAEIGRFRSVVLRNVLPALSAMVAVAVALAIWVTMQQIRGLQSGGLYGRTSLQLLLGLYGPLFTLRLVTIVLGAVGFVLAAWHVTRQRQPILNQIGPVYLGFLLIIVGEILGRFLFYAIHIRQGL